MSGPITRGAAGVPEGAARLYFPEACEAKLAAVHDAVAKLDDALALAGWPVDKRLVAGSAASSTAILETAIDPGGPDRSEAVLLEARISGAITIFSQLLEPVTPAMRETALARLCLIHTAAGRDLVAAGLETQGEA